MKDKKEKVLLKDQLFTKEKVRQVAREIKSVHSSFDAKKFEKEVLAGFPERELKQRIVWMREQLQVFLPNDFRTAIKILLKSLPSESDPTLTDNDFGDFIYAAYGDFVSAYGCTKGDVVFSLNALKELTTRFSVEGPIRCFINEFPAETMKKIEKWSTDKHYHVRRLASEGTRPLLPWAERITLDPKKGVKILDQLYSDPTRFVTRSVANHLNDVSKNDSDLVLKTLKRWQKSRKQNDKEMEYIINHSLRTLVKRGDKAALAFLNFSGKPQVKVTRFKIVDAKMSLGEALQFSFMVTATADESLVIDYTLYFPSKGKTYNRQVYKLKKVHLKKGEHRTIEKKHPLKANMTTRKLRAGKHKIEVQVNGTVMAAGDFVIV